MIKKTVYDKLVTKVNAIDTKIPITSGIVTRTQYDSDKQGPEKNIEVPTERYQILVGSQYKSHRD